MARKMGMAALAAAARVSVATVDRALNGREQVSPVMRARLAEAALRIGHPAATRLGGTDPDRPRLRLGVVLHKAGQEFYQNMAREMRHAAASAPDATIDLSLEFSASQAPGEVAALMRAMGQRCDAIAATAVNHPEITSAVDALRARGVPVFSLLSDFAQGARAGYVGLNNLKVGRVAAWMIGLAARQPGKVAIFVGGLRWHGHELRETGFRSYLREARPDLEVMEALINLETRQLTYEATTNLLARQPDLRGLYVAGGGMEGAIAAIREQREPGQVVLVVNELTAESRQALAEGWVTLIDATPLPDLCRDVVAMMTRAALHGAGDSGVQHFLNMEMHVAEGL